MCVCVCVCVQAAHVCTPLVLQAYTPVLKDHGLWLCPLLLHLLHIWRDTVYIYLFHTHTNTHTHTQTTCIYLSAHTIPSLLFPIFKQTHTQTTSLSPSLSFSLSLSLSLSLYLSLSLSLQLTERISLAQSWEGHPSWGRTGCGYQNSPALPATHTLCRHDDKTHGLTSLDAGSAC